MNTHILCTTDNKYVPYCGIMLTSLFENNKDLDIKVYIMCEELHFENINAFQALSEKYNVPINIIVVNNDTFKDCPIRIGDHVSIAAYYRLIAEKVLPKDITKILYLDCDIIVNGSIKELYRTDITDYAFGAIKDEAYFLESKYKYLGYSKEYSYINSGIILFNIEYWRKEQLSNKCLDYISKHPERIKFHDQDTLNAILHKEMKLLPIKYNFQTGFLLTQYTQYYKEEIKEIMQYVASPIIIHYTGPNKPWHKGCKHPYKKRFIHYKSISLWRKTQVLERRTPKEITRNFIHEIMWRIGIKKEPQTYIIKEQD